MNLRPSKAFWRLKGGIGIGVRKEEGHGCGSRLLAGFQDMISRLSQLYVLYAEHIGGLISGKKEDNFVFSLKAQ